MEANAKKLKVVCIFLLALLTIEILFLSSRLFSSLDARFEIPKGILQHRSKSAPVDRISRSDIEVYSDKIIIKLNNASLSEYAETGSMRPILDAGANGIRIAPKNESEIKVGDIVTFESNGELLVHRVIKIGKDDEGTYFITKGDNNWFSDGKIRFEQIKYITVGVIY